MPHSLTITQIALMAGILLLAGLTKGILGVGLPLVAVPLLSQVVPVPTAIMTLAASTVLSNGFQAMQGGQIILVVQRFWPLFVPLIIGVFSGAWLLVSLDERIAGFIMGVLLLLFTVLNRYPRLTQIEVHQEKLISPIVGIISGILGGISSFFGPPILIYMVALRLPKTFFISAVSTAFFLGAVPLMMSLALYGALGRDELVLSALGVIPVFAGLLLGQHIQNRLPQEAFNKRLFGFLIVMGASLVLRSLFE